MSAQSSVDPRRRHFRMLAQILVDLEVATIQKFNLTGTGFPLDQVQLYLDEEGVTEHGKAVVLAMIESSELIQVDEEKKNLIPHKDPDDGAIDALFTEVQS